MIQITDEITGRTAHVEEVLFADTVEHWFPQCPREIIDAIENVQSLISAHALRSEARYLGLAVYFE